MKTYTINKDYTLSTENYQLLLPLDLAIMIPADDSVRLLSQVLEELDYSKLYRAYSSQGRKSAVSPRVFFKILVYSYMNNIYTSRKIEEACKRDVNFMWLLQGEKAPDHNSISRFRKERLSDGVMDDLFNQLIEKLHRIGEVTFKTLFIDGTKIEANANKYTFVWKKAVQKSMSKMHTNIQSFIEDINMEYGTDFKAAEDDITTALKKVEEHLSKICKDDNITFVHGIGKRKSRLQKDLEGIRLYISRQEKYCKSMSLFGDRNSYSKTDTDATFMHMKDDHMRNSQLKPGYNAQIGVEAEYIIGLDISAERSDVNTFIPFMTRLNNSLSHKFEKVVADSGYESEENYLFLEHNGQQSYIKPQTYEKWKKKSFKKDISKRENMIYDEISDIYICHNQKRLLPISKKSRKSKSGYIAEVTLYECEDCKECQHKDKCTKASGNKRLEVSKTFLNKRMESLNNITTQEGILLRINRSIQVEGAFGVLKENYRFKQFLTRGNGNVKIEFSLLCFGYNLNKLHQKIQDNRCGKPLFRKDCVIA